MRRNQIHRGCQAEILIPTSLERVKKGPSLDKSGSGRQSLLRRGGSAPVSHHSGRKKKTHANAHAPPPCPGQSGGHRRAPASPRTVGTAPGLSAQFPTVFVFSPTGKPWEPREALVCCAPGGGTLSFFSLYLPLHRGCSRQRPPFPVFPPWALWVPVKSADFLPVDVAGSHIQETQARHTPQRERQTYTGDTGLGGRPPFCPIMGLADGARNPRPGLAVD